MDTTSSTFYGIETIEDVRKAGFLSVMTPDQAVEFATQHAISITPLISGLSPKTGWKMLELFVEKVLPKLQGA